MKSGHDWLVAVVAVVASMVVNGMLLAYSYGKMEHRVQTLEKQSEQLRDDWKVARDRIERAIKEDQPK
jgi:outer membrane murein-binding lipoprotein Lpp